MRWMVWAFVTLFCTGGSAQSQSDAHKRARLDQVASSYTANNAFMGAVLVTDGDQILLDKGYGMAVMEWNVPNAPDTKFRLGSTTKQFTAALVLLMQQDGTLNINDPVSKYLPSAPKTWGKVTLLNLLEHTSGIPNFTTFKEFGAWAASAHTWDEEYAFFKDRPLEFEPGTKFSYSNSNYEVLGGILERVSGQKYSDLLRERIFSPLGMKDSGVESDDLILPKRAEGYRSSLNGLVVARSESMSVPFSAGAIFSTTGDLLKWEHGLFEGKLLSADSLREMTTPGKDNYGLGVTIQNDDGVRVVEHGGEIEGFDSMLIYAPDKRVCVVVLGNVQGPVPGQMAQQLLETALGRKALLNSERKPVPIANSELAKFSGVYDVGHDLYPPFFLTIAQDGDVLTMQGARPPAQPMMYQGVVNGHPRFFSPAIGAEIEFVPDAEDNIQSLIFHSNGANMPGQRQ